MVRVLTECAGCGLELVRGLPFACLDAGKDTAVYHRSCVPSSLLERVQYIQPVPNQPPGVLVWEMEPIDAHFR